MRTSIGRGFRFGVFELDLEQGQLRRDGLVVKLPPQPFKLLTILVQRSGAVVGRKEIQAVLWDTDTFVDFNQGVNFAIRQIREALGDSADNPRWIQTLPRRGYRFLGPAEPLGGSAGVDSGPQRRTATDVRLQFALWANIAELRLSQVRRQRSLRIIAIVALVVIAVLVLALVTARMR